MNYYSTCRTLDGRHPGISVGDVVIIHDENLPRGLWKLGVIQCTIKGKGGQIGGATVKIAKRNKQHYCLDPFSYYIRSKLAILAVSNCSREM